MNAKGRREPDNGYGLLMESWDGIEIDRMCVGGPGRWESVALGRFREYLDREDGLSVRERWRLANDSRRNQKIKRPLPRACARQNVRHDVRRNAVGGCDANSARGLGGTNARGHG